METIDFAEKAVDASLRDARASYDAMHERAYKFATLTMGASGAVSIYALGKIGADGYLWHVIPMALLATWWFVAASALLLKGAATNEMSAGTTSAKIRERVTKHSKKEEGEPDLEQGLNLTRWDQVAAADNQIQAFSDANIERAKSLDAAYRWMVASPLAGMTGLVLAYVIQR